MRVFERMGRMVRADAHGVLDQLEERTLILKQALREAEIEVAHKCARLDALNEERRRVRKEGRRLEARVAALDEDLELALGGEDRNLARYAAKRWLAERDALTGLFASAAHFDEERERLVEKLQEQQAQLAELRPRVQAALARRGGDDHSWVAQTMISEEEVDLELLRRSSGSGAAQRGGPES